jgi:predicted transcriptional regulator
MSARLGITRRLWLFMLEHGGHWTTAELAEQLGEDNTYIDRILWSMHDHGSLSKYRSSQRKNGSAFGVTAKNRIPQGLTLADVTKATQVREAIVGTTERAAA